MKDGVIDECSFQRDTILPFLLGFDFREGDSDEMAVSLMLSCP